MYSNLNQQILIMLTLTLVFCSDNEEIETTDEKLNFEDKKELSHNQINKVQSPSLEYAETVHKEQAVGSGNIDRNVVFFNRVTKAGTLTLMQLLRFLSTKNGFTLMRDNGFSTKLREDIMLSYEQQMQLKTIFRSFNSPTVYLKHTGFVDFEQLNSPMPIYINIVRDPLERVNSIFYFRRSPSQADKMKKIYPGIPLPSKKYFLQEFKSCVNEHNPECMYIEGIRRYDTAQLTEFFCGQDLYCSGFNTDAALRKAKDNVERHYAVVGVLEDFNKTLAVLEHYIPTIFKGSLNIYWESLKGKHENNNLHKKPLDKTIRDVLQRNFTREIEFYEFCKHRLDRQYKNMLGRAPKIEL